MKKQVGFTLVELVVVIAVLGILAATALPRFINVQGKAKEAALNGLAASLKSGVNLTKAGYVASGNVSPVQLDGATVTTNGSGFPTADADGIEKVLQSNDVTPAPAHAAGVSTFTVKANCTVTYTAATGVVATTVAGCST